MHTVSSPTCCRCVKLLKNVPLFSQAHSDFSTSSLRTIPEQNHYEVLGVKRTATNGEIRSAFVQLSKEVHPDKNHGSQTNHNKFVAINEAYSILSKPSSRQDYDYKLASRKVQQHNSSYTYTSNMHAHDSDHYPYRWDYKKPDYSNYRKIDEDNYYGVKGVRRQPNSVIAFMCTGLIGIGFLMFFGAYKYTKYKIRTVYDERSKEYENLRQEVNNRVSLYGVEGERDRFLASMIENSNRRPAPPITGRIVK